MNAELYLAVVEAIGPRLVEIAHGQVGITPRQPWQSEPDSTRAIDAPEFDLALDLLPMSQHVYNARRRGKVDAELVALVKNHLTLLCRDAIDTLRYSPSTHQSPGDQMLVCFKPNSVRFDTNVPRKQFGHGANVEYRQTYKELIISRRRFKADYFGLRNYDKIAELEEV